MEGIPNPNRKLVLVFAVVGVIGIILTTAGALNGIDGWGLYGMVFGGIAALLGVLMVPILHSTGKKQIKTIEALMRGENLLAHWQFDRSEWEKYTESEYARGLKIARTGLMWGMGITLLIVLFVVWISEAPTLLGVAGLFGIIGGLVALVGALLWFDAKAAHSRNLAGVGEVYIGPAYIYFAGRFYTWEDRRARLTKVAFEQGDPCVVEFGWEYGSGDNSSAQSVRVPVPRGREPEAEHLVVRFHGAA